MVVSAYLICFKQFYKKIYFKEYCLVEQSLYKLKTEEAKTGSNPTVVETTNILKVVSPVSEVHWLLLTDLFAFDFSFS